jgi:hypothetical protein
MLLVILSDNRLHAIYFNAHGFDFSCEDDSNHLLAPEMQAQL